VYRRTATGAFGKDFGLRDQLRRAAVSIMSAVAEGFEHGSDKEFRRYLYIAKGSAGEVRSLFYVALDAGYLSRDEHGKLMEKIARISRLLAGFIGYLDGRKREQATE
jgi:four helix bundle protein